MTERSVIIGENEKYYVYYNVIQGTRHNLVFVHKRLCMCSIPLHGSVANNLFEHNYENRCTTSQTSYKLSRLLGYFEKFTLENHVIYS